jgi:hypothetical protein
MGGGEWRKITIADWISFTFAFGSVERGVGGLRIEGGGGGRHLHY